jgi:hypothetical protein
MRKDCLMLTSRISHPAGLPVLPLFDVPIDENGFVDWLIDAEPGAMLVYYRGHLSHDRMASTEVHDPSRRSVLNRLASRVMTAAEDGLVLLVQKRLAANDALYIAIRARGGLKMPSPAPRTVRERKSMLLRRIHSPTSMALAA